MKFSALRVRNLRKKGLPFSAMAPAKKAPAKKLAKKAPAKKLAKKAPAKPAKPAQSAKPIKKAPAASKGRPFPKKNEGAPTPAPVKSAPAAGKASKASKSAGGSSGASSATSATPSNSSSSSTPNDGFQRRLLLPPPPKVERKSKHALKPLRDIPTPLIVSGSENPWSKDELKEMKARLTKDLATYKQELASAEAQAAELLQDSSDGAGDDQADAGTKTFEREHELSLVYNAQDLVLQTELALARIAAGSYTKCEICGNPIGKARLQVFPRATLCMLCKQKEERR